MEKNKELLIENKKFEDRKLFNINTNPKYSENSMLLKPSYNNTNDGEIQCVFK